MNKNEPESDYSPKPMDTQATLLLFVKILIAGGAIAGAIWALDHFGI
ncbi:MAG: hypothetical protein IPM24_01680 [Bryobacterales bacterium]|nr:hypothetical protein [Bryobacterales bacterium]